MNSKFYTKLMRVVLSWTVVFGAASAKAADQEIPVGKLNDIGVCPENAISAFQNIHGISLDLNSVLKVSPHEEGSSLKLETLDHLSVVVPHADARGPLNKITRPTDNQKSLSHE